MFTNDDKRPPETGASFFYTIIVVWADSKSFVLSCQKINPVPVRLFFSILLACSCYTTQAQTSAALLAELEKATSAKAKADVCYLLSSRYSNFLKIDSALYYADRVKTYSEQNGYQAGIGKYWLARASALRMRSRFAEAQENLKKAIDIFSKEKDVVFLGRAYQTLASTYSIQGINDSAVSFYKTAIHYTTMAGDEPALGKQYFEMGKAFYHTYQPDSAVIYLTKALALAEKSRDDQRIFLIAGSLGSLFLTIENFREARQYLEYSLKNQAPISDNISLMLRLGDYSYCLVKLREFAAADSTIKIIEQIAPANDDWSQAYLNDLKGNLQSARGNYQQAHAYYLRAYTLPMIEMEFGNRHIIFNLGKTEVQLSRYRDAIGHLHEAKKFYRKIGFAPNEMLVDSLISESFAAIGNSDSALHYFRSYELLKDSVRSLQKLKTIIDVSARYESEKKEQEIKILEKEAAYQKLLAANHNQQKNIAWISILVILVAGSYFTYRYLRKRKLQNQQEVLNERLRISRELHDEVGSTLSGIAMYSHLTKEQIKAEKTADVERSLNTIQQSAAEMVGKLDDIVWLVNPGKDSFQKLIERLEEFAADMAGIKNIELKIDVDTHLRQMNMPVDRRRDIYLFCKEAINNAIKYSNADLIELTMKELDNKQIGLYITDNGNGFDPQKVRNGNGLTNMQQRASAINGRFALQTSPGLGTTLSLIYKIT